MFRLFFVATMFVSCLACTELEEEFELEEETELEEDSELECYVGHVLIERAADIDLIRDYTCVTGDIAVVSEFEIQEVILPDLKWIGGGLHFFKNGNLVTIDMTGLEIIGGHFTMYQNPLLPNMDGFESLKVVVDYMTIFDNASLNSLEGLESLESVHRKLQIVRNGNLPDCDVCGVITTTSASEYISLDNLEDDCSPTPECPEY